MIEFAVIQVTTGTVGNIESHRNVMKLRKSRGGDACKPGDNDAAETVGENLPRIEVDEVQCRHTLFISSEIISHVLIADEHNRQYH